MQHVSQNEFSSDILLHASLATEPMTAPLLQHIMLDNHQLTSVPKEHNIYVASQNFTAICSPHVLRNYSKE
jgi:hypothetical protein